MKAATCALLGLLTFIVLGCLPWSSLSASCDSSDPVAGLDTPLSSICPGNASSTARSQAQSFHVLWSTPRVRDVEATLALFREEADWKNSLVSWTLPQSVWDSLPRIAQAWYRNMIGATLLYLGCGFVWAYYIYFVFGDQLFGSKANMPAWPDMFEQMKVTAYALPLYSALPTITEWIVERGWTKAYPRISDVGYFWYCVLLVVYMTWVEYGVYWMHRGLHDVKAGYQALHFIHHKYNKEHTLSPFAGLAFHPLDGILQAIPYTIGLFVLPMHLMTHELLLFATGVWTANIHDNIHGAVEPIMGAGYHTIHHTIYKYNYGHYFTFMDWLHGTLMTPREYVDLTTAAKAKST